MENLISTNDLLLFVHNHCVKLKALDLKNKGLEHIVFDKKKCNCIRVIFPDKTLIEINLYPGSKYTSFGNVLTMKSNGLWINTNDNISARTKKELLEMVVESFNMKKMAINKQKMIINSTARCFR